MPDPIQVGLSGCLVNFLADILGLSPVAGRQLFPFNERKADDVEPN